MFGPDGRAGAARFIWVWLAASILNGAVGVKAGIPLINEIGAFIPIFGIPAAAAWFLAYATGCMAGFKAVRTDRELKCPGSSGLARGRVDWSRSLAASGRAR